MKQPRAQGAYKDSRVRRAFHVRNTGKSLCIRIDPQETIQTTSLDRVLKHHAKHCVHWIFSGDRHCSCGRDAAILELDRIRGRLCAMSVMSRPNNTKDNLHNQLSLPSRKSNKSFRKSGDEKEV